MSSQRSFSRSRAGGGKFTIMTSARLISFSRTPRASVFLRSSEIERFSLPSSCQGKFTLARG